MTTQDIETRIIKAFPDAELAVFDSNGGGNHFEVRISSEAINALPRIKRHQTILQLFDPEFKTGELHALSVKPIQL